jgi:ubiquinone/menaquinone biosynthesis C-methylase UbiE
MAVENEGNAKRGQAIYTRPFLAMYDWVVLGFFCRFVWKCPSHHMLELYNQHISANHLDIGVGTGYFLDHSKFPVDNPRLALMDLNPNSLRKCESRLKRYNPEIYRANVLELDGSKFQKFDSVSLTNLLHCLPGTMETKRIVFGNIRSLLNPDGVVFGSTIPYKGVRHSFLAEYFINTNNARGIMTNKQDDLEGLEQNLAQHFSDSSVKAIGSMALFRAKK